MTTIELAHQIRDVRAAQRTYFRERTMEALEESKRLERQLDKLVKEILEDKSALLPGFGESEDDHT